MPPRLVVLLAAVIVLAASGCLNNAPAIPADYASFQSVGSRQWVTQVEGLTPENTPKIRELVEGVAGVEKGSVLIKADYVAFISMAEREDMLEHTRVGEEVRTVLKGHDGLRVGGSMTGPQ
jgi:hypothetical protein